MPAAIILDEAPPRTYAQRMDALNEANRIRRYRAQLKRDVAAGRVRVTGVLDWQIDVASMKVWDLLLALPKVGRVKVDKTLRQLRISPTKTVAGMSPRQRFALLVWLAGR